MSAEISIGKSTFDVVCVVVTRDESFSRVTSRYQIVNQNTLYAEKRT